MRELDTFWILLFALNDKNPIMTFETLLSFFSDRESHKD